MSKISNKLSLKGNLSKFHYSILGSLLALIVVGHFFMQMSFITKEKGQFDESQVKVEMPDEQIIQTVSESIENIAETKQPEQKAADIEIILPKKQIEPDKINQVKVVQKEILRRSTVVALPISKKQNVANIAKSERLRKAEKLLTGF